MEKEALACISLTKFEDYSKVKMKGSVRDLFSLTAVLVHRLAEELDKSPWNVLMEIDHVIMRAQIFEMPEGAITHDE